MRKPVNVFGKWVSLLLLMGTSPCASAMEIDVANAPSDNLPLTVAALKSAKKSIQLNIYELTSPEITQALLDRIQHNIQVTLLQEGQPVGGLSAAAKGIQSQLVSAMIEQGGSEDHLYEMRGKKPVKRRFRWDHAKYAVIDGDSVLIGSENYSPTGNPASGALGNRGWEVWIHDAELAAQFSEMFRGDSDPSNPDIVNIIDVPHPAPAAPTAPDSGVPRSLTALSATAVEKISSPDTSEAAITHLIQQAQKQIDIEQMTFDSRWGSGGGESPILQALVSAARRKVRIRVLLNDESVFKSSSVPKNQATADLLNQVASSEKLSMAAKIADVKAMGVDYIHNKGIIVDGNLTLVSSVNWDENSFLDNREAAVLITSPAISSYYENLFQQDWDAGRSAGLLSSSVRFPDHAHAGAKGRLQFPHGGR